MSNAIHAGTEGKHMLDCRCEVAVLREAHFDTPLTSATSSLSLPA